MNGKLKSLVKSLAEVVKPLLCLHISLSALFGFALANRGLSQDGGYLGLSVLVLALGCAALNNVQDMEFDAWFARTRHRALPSKRLNPGSAVVLGAVLILSGLGGLLFSSNAGLLPPGLGVLALVCYNGLYTPMKKKSLLAIVPGALSGMLPPLIGWSAGGRSILDPEILLIMTIMGVWQIPHFFLLLLKSNRPDFGEVPYPSFSERFSGVGLKLQVMIWCGLYSLSLFLYLFRVAALPGFALATAINALGILFWTGFSLVNSNPSKAFAGINLSILAFMGTGILGALA
ncbi:UbiA family prenyltransferase [Desulfospira joergensenii]|uniref:UbiA family prenyltransferase n=1 Tax=Desulfospira joergensenii TaxID=53329 RepID=UPI0003B3D4C7|nr:UbiA family prenyltransferase [Desulfospira joergensenii]